MSNFPLSSFLRRALLADAAVSAVAGLVMLLGARPLEDLLGLPELLLRGAGGSLLPYAAFLAFVASRKSVRGAVVGAIIAYNLLWAADSLLLLLSGWVPATGLGIAFVVAQAVVVALLADVQYLGLRRMGRSVGA